jgi:low affinity Fe/Cu permease
MEPTFHFPETWQLIISTTTTFHIFHGVSDSEYAKSQRE